MLRDRLVHQLRRRVEASGANLQITEDAEGSDLGNNMLDLILSLEVWDVPTEAQQWDPAATVQEVRDAVGSTASYLALRESADANAPRLQ